MKRLFLALVALTGLAAVLTGCVGTEDGHSKFGVPFTKDTITSRYEKPAAQLATAVRIVLKRNGALTLDNTVNNTFAARIDQHDVWVKVTDLDGKVTEVGVQSRGRLGGDVDLASEISTQIGMELMAQR